RYQSFPYQKFGQFHGTVTSVSRAAISPGELPPQLAGLASAASASGSQPAAAEPVYRVTVSLASQYVTAYGKPVPLQAGMLTEADVELEKRRLYEWVLD